MSFNAVFCSVGELLSNEGLYYIPSYQRPYCWTTDTALSLFDDIHRSLQDAIPELTLGTVMLCDKSDGTGNRYGIVDGQQRLITITIILCILRDLSISVGQQKRIHQSIHNNAQLQWILMIRSMDQSYFEYNVQMQHRANATAAAANANKYSEPQKSSNETQNNIIDNLCQLHHHIRKKLKTDMEIEMYYNHLMNQCKIVRFQCSTLKQSIHIFNVTNARGQRLAEIDILKSHYLSLLNNGSEMSDYAREWEAQELAVEGRSQLQSLLQYARQASDNMEQIDFVSYWARQKHSAKEFLQHTLMPVVKAWNAIYKKNLSRPGETHDNLTVLNSCNKVLAFLWLGVDTKSTSYPLWLLPVLLFVSFRYNTSHRFYGSFIVEGESPTDQDLFDFLTSIERIHAIITILKFNSDMVRLVWRQITHRLIALRDPMNNTQSARQFTATIDDVLTALSTGTTRSKKKASAWQDETAVIRDVLHELNSDMYSTATSSCVRYVLCRYDSEHDLYKQFHSYNTHLADSSKQLEISIEHILPQTINRNNESWKRVCVEWEDEIKRAEVVHKLGNLAVLERKFNSAAQNVVMSAKYAQYAKSEFASTRALINPNRNGGCKPWTYDELQCRHQLIIKTLAALWNLHDVNGHVIDHMANLTLQPKSYPKRTRKCTKDQLEAILKTLKNDATANDVLDCINELKGGGGDPVVTENVDPLPTLQVRLSKLQRLVTMTVKELQRYSDLNNSTWSDHWQEVLRKLDHIVLS